MVYCKDLNCCIVERAELRECKSICGGESNYTVPKISFCHCWRRNFKNFFLFFLNHDKPFGVPKIQGPFLRFNECPMFTYGFCLQMLRAMINQTGFCHLLDMFELSCKHSITSAKLYFNQSFQGLPAPIPQSQIAQIGYLSLWILELLTKYNQL